MNPPALLTSDMQSITVVWDDIASEYSIIGYHLRYRSEEEITWHHIDQVITNHRCKKKNLQPNVKYYFSVLPINQSKEAHEGKPEICWSYSTSSPPLALATSLLSPFLQNLLPPTLLSKDSRGQHIKGNTIDLLSQCKVIGIYFSAHWCGPCRQFTPQLMNVYNTVIKQSHFPMEIIFCSGDQSEEDFHSYYREMSWLAIDFEDEKREGLMSLFKVKGIPSLTILSHTGRIIAENATRQPLNAATIESWVKMSDTM
jgi:thiol-disulfide isomerase/thioredoxin